jgi:hypothetical protein
MRRDENRSEAELLAVVAAFGGALPERVEERRHGDLTNVRE